MLRVLLLRIGIVRLGRGAETRTLLLVLPLQLACSEIRWLVKEIASNLLHFRVQVGL